MNQPSLEELIQKLHSFSPRLFDNQIKAADYIKNLLSQAALVYSVETFDTEVPNILKAELIVDGETIPCRSTSLVSGTIDQNCHIVDASEEYSHSGGPNLNYNGKSDVISRAAHYEVPSLAFSRKDLDKVKNAQEIKGIVEIERKFHTSQNIILGNLTNPINIAFTHFDSLEGGAMDNASGTAITILTILNNPKLLENNLFVISSDEELSFDSPCYWGKGYRDFQKKHSDIIDSCQKMYIIDSFGLTTPRVHQYLIDEYFPIVNIDKYVPKTFAVSCEESAQWSVYHSADDIPQNLDPRHLEEGLVLVNQILSK